MQCPHCFREVNTAGPCPFCGFDGSDQEQKYPRALKPGSILNGRYILGHVLGQGGFGITYIALDYRSGQRMAIKEYFPAEFVGRTGSGTVQVDSAGRREDYAYGKAQFLEEAETLAAFTGTANIVRIYSYFEENATAYLCMEYVDGLPLDKYMAKRGGKLTPEEANRLLLPLMESLEEVHARGIVHRDIAPDNILIDGDGTAKLIDFGAARYSTGEKTQSMTVIMKHGFAPFEQYLRRARQGPWTDVYALAATYYYAITGRVPPDSAERRDEDELIPPSALGAAISPAQEASLLKGLAVSAGERFQSMDEFRRAMAETSGETTNASKSEPLGRPAPAVRTPPKAESKPVPAAVPTPKRAKLPLIVAIAAVLALAVFGVTRLSGSRGESPAVTSAPETNAPAVTAEPSAAVESPAPSPASTFEELLAAAETGDADAMYEVGWTYYSGEGIAKDYTRAMEWFTRSAEAGNAKGMYMTGLMYNQGMGTAEPDYGKAMEWYRKSADAGHGPAMFKIGHLYYNGDGVEQDYAQAMEWFRKRADTGDAASMSMIGLIFFSDGPQQDYAQAMEWFQKAADAGLASSMSMIGMMYRHGLGTEKDCDKAIEWYLKAVDAGETSDMREIGDMYYAGEGVTQDYGAALEWYRKGADAGDAWAMYRIGTLYKYGHGVKKDAAMAEEWFAKAKAAGYPG